MVLEANPRLEDYQLKEKRIAIRFSITGHATAANVTHSTDIPGICFVSTAGNLADSEDSGMNVTESDGPTNSVFGILLKEVGSVKKMIDAECKDLGAESGGSDTSTAVAVTWAGASNTGITASDNLAFSVAATGLDLSAAESFSGVIILKYLMAE
jgi:hypothetical protein